MSHERQLLLYSSLTALGVLRTRNRMGRRPSSPPRSIQLSPEPDPSSHTLELGQDQTTGPLPLGFEFELFGVRYTWFEISTDGFMTFGPHPSAREAGGNRRARYIPVDIALNNFIALGGTDTFAPGRRLIAYDIRGEPARRRLVLSLTEVPERPTAGLQRASVQVVLHERTGMIDVRVSAAPREHPDAA